MLTGEKLFELLDAIVEEVGEENVVQVATAPTRVAATEHHLQRLNTIGIRLWK